MSTRAPKSRTASPKRTRQAKPSAKPPDKPLGVAVQHSLRLLNRMAAEARHTLLAADVEAVHDLRISIRRLMASLDLFDAGLGEHGGRKIRKRIKKLLDFAGAVRDCDVAAKYVEKFGTVPQESAQLLAAIQARRNESVPALLAGLQDRIDRQSIAKWRAKLRTAPGNGEVEETAREILDQMFQEFMKRGQKAANPHASGRQLHHFRIAAKSLHYGLELPVAPENPAWMEGAKAVQKLVGEIHDCEAVRALIAGMPGSEGVTKALRHRQAKKRSQFRDLWNLHLAGVPGTCTPAQMEPAAETAGA